MFKFKFLLPLFILFSLVLGACQSDQEQVRVVVEVVYPTVEATTPETKTTSVSANDEYRYPAGFTISSDAVDLRDDLHTRPPTEDLSDYYCFPQDYGMGDSNNPGCKELQEKGQLPWSEPLAGFSFSYNDACRDNTRRCNIQIPSWNWMAVSGEEINLPGLGSLRDPDGGAVLVVILNAWEVPGEWVGAYILHGWWGTGETWDMSDLTTEWSEESQAYTNNQYGDFSIETAATLRDHFLFSLMESETFRGQCSKGLNCETVTYVTGFRWYDGSFHIVDSGQHILPNN